MLQKVIFIFVVCLQLTYGLNYLKRSTQPETESPSPPAENYTIVPVVGQQLRYINNFKPCKNAENFCEIMCPMHCGHYNDKLDYCNCTGCYCLCGIGIESPRDESNHLICFNVDFSSQAFPSQPEKHIFPEEGHNFLTKIQNISATTTPPPKPEN